MSNIGIIGYGFVGKAVEYGFKDSHKILIHDTALPSLSLEEVVKDSDYIFICLPTPMTSNYTKTDLSILEGVVKQVVEFSTIYNVSPLIVIKSTVVPGTTSRLSHELSSSHMAFNPEFLTEANYLDDFVHPDRIVIGADSEENQQKLFSLYNSSFPQAKIFITDSVSAEMVKYMCNTYLATKVVFANEMFDICHKLNVDYNAIKTMAVADHRIFDSHLDISSKRGFGGKCFPKDLVALLGLANDLGVDTTLLRAVWEKNLKIRLDRDWENIPGAVSKQAENK